MGFHKSPICLIVCIGTVVVYLISIAYFFDGTNDIIIEIVTGGLFCCCTYLACLRVVGGVFTLDTDGVTYLSSLTYLNGICSAKYYGKSLASL